MRVDNTGWIGIANRTLTATGTWTEYSLTFNSGSNTAIIISFRDSNAGTKYIDDVYCGTGSGPTPTPTPTPTPGQGGLPAAIVGEWWWAWDPPTIGTIMSEAPKINFLSLAGTGVGGGGTGTVHTGFSVPGYSQSQMIADIDAWKASGRCVIGMVGGGGDTTVINNSTNVTQFMNSIIPIIDTYHLQGIDFDFENTPNAASIASCITQLKAHYGSSFIIAISPRPYELRSGGVYRSVIQQAGIANIDLVQPQTYALLGDSLAAQRSYMDADLSDWFGSGLIPASKLSIGSYFPGGEGLTESAQTCKDTYTYYKGVYPTLRGATNWETRDDRLNGWQFATQLGQVVH
jgi:Glycosyl hydrolases family 18